MKLPSKIRGWFNPKASPEKLLASYIATNNKQDLALLVEQFNLSLYHYLLSQSDKELAEDVLQSSWLKVMNVKTAAREHTNVKSWLFTIARNTLIDELRRRQRWQWQDVEQEELTGQPLEQEMAGKDALAKFNQAINRLPFFQREVFILQQEGFSLLEIAGLTSETFETVKSRLRYARSNIKKLLGPEL
ncbi:sigma-70 family RNA polymerase sigma factor [Thalassomonas viridans]|uniref:Sigma-70 family RNA polymerase sigma factor n=1 Tax=Thalassomonas viridans TaxID=137584 RepID=A0AAE9Z295_9GAMM|nr:sigma-70 family RNA polymerase sigma factor [Thalassomonas viridans]WDE05253.1 sigma-70 family RNA polymerase sigma factor [Thalassomonas viridans]